MYFYRDGWNFVYFVDAENNAIQRKMYFNGVIEVFDDTYNLHELFNNVQQFGWLMVDKKFLDDEIDESQYIKYGTKIDIDTGFGWEQYTLCQIGQTKFTLIRDGQCWGVDYMESNNPCGVKLSQLEAHIDCDFKIVNET